MPETVAKSSGFQASFSVQEGSGFISGKQGKRNNYQI